MTPTLRALGRCAAGLLLAVLLSHHPLLPSRTPAGSSAPTLPHALAPPHTLAAQSDEVVLRFLDVGQGDAVLITGPDGRHVLYDGGRTRDGAMEHLDALGIDRLELVIASHPHADHIGGLVRVIAELEPALVLDSGLPHTTATYERYLDAIENAGAQLLDPDPRVISLGEAELHVLPPPGDPSLSLNDNSVGLVIRYGDFTATLGGDAEQAQWAWWVAESYLPTGPVQVHKASHHGSRNGDTAEGLGKLRPHLVVVSAGADNMYGHPHPEALARYRALGATVVGTPEAGTVTAFGSRDGSMRVEVERGSFTFAEAPSPWPSTPPAASLPTFSQILECPPPPLSRRTTMRQLVAPSPPPRSSSDWRASDSSSRPWSDSMPWTRAGGSSSSSFFCLIWVSRDMRWDQAGEPGSTTRSIPWSSPW